MQFFRDGRIHGQHTKNKRGRLLTLISKNNLPTASYVSQTSSGNFHITWNYNDPLPWTNKGESFWISQQKKLIKLFKQGGFLVDKGASLNPCQNLRNPSQLHAYNYKRRCKVEIHNSYQKTSLRRIYKALNKSSVPNPKRPPTCKHKTTALFESKPNLHPNP